MTDKNTLEMLEHLQGQLESAIALMNIPGSIRRCSVSDVDVLRRHSGAHAIIGDYAITILGGPYKPRE
jgi:hypothetical protein